MFDTIVPIKIKRLENCFDIPKYQTNGAAAMDLYAAMPNNDAIFIPEGGIGIIPTGIAIALPEGYEAQIRPRSGLATKGITVVNSPGTIDSDYRGEIKVIIANLRRSVEEDEEFAKFVAEREEEYRAQQSQAEEHGIRLVTVHADKHFIVKRGDRIAQMLIAPVYRGVFTEVDTLDETQRGEGGFGSTGTK